MDGLSVLQVLQHTATTAFTGVEQGRSSLTLGAGASSVAVKARNLGAALNGVEVRLHDPGQASALAVKYSDGTTPRITVTLAHDGSAITSTAAQVVAAINTPSLDRDGEPGLYGMHRQFLASAPSSGGSGVVVAASGTLAGGADPTLLRTYDTCRYSAANGGLFYFNQTNPIEIVAIEAVLGASRDETAYTVSIVSYDDLSEVTAETVQFATGTAQHIYLMPSNLILPRGRAIKFVSATTGVVRIHARNVQKTPR